MKPYETWREAEVHRVGTKTQNEAETILEKQSLEPFVERNDEKSGKRVQLKRNIAKILDGRGQTTTVKVYTSPNSQAYKDGWERIFGNKVDQEES